MNLDVLENGGIVCQMDLHAPQDFIIDHKVKTTGFSRSALAAIIDCPVKEARDGLSIWQSYGFSD